MNLKFWKVLTFLFCACSYYAHATHYVGNEIRYQNLGQNTYRVTIIYYTDCEHGDPIPISQDNPLYWSIFSSDQNRALFHSDSDVKISFVPTRLLNTYGGCGSKHEVCINATMFSKEVFLPVNKDGYTLANARCCMSNEIENLDAPGNQGLTVAIDIKTDVVNSSPEFKYLPPSKIIAGEPFAINCSATDSDGDSLVYRLAPMYGGGTTGNAKPVLRQLSYVPVRFKAGASASNPLYGHGTVNVNPYTGVVSGICNDIGAYIFSIACDEYRNGRLLSSATRTFTYTFVESDGTRAVIASSGDLFARNIDTLTITQCNGSNTIHFINKSTGAQTYSWNFGDPTTTADVSSATEPDYTYPGPGTYMARLIAMGTGCSDTLYTRIIITDDEIHPDFTISGKYCTNAPLELTDNSVVVRGIVKSYGWKYDNEWQEGVTAATFVPKEPGNRVVTHFVMTEKGCVAAVSKNVDIYRVNVQTIPDTIVVKGTPLLLPATGADQYEWTPAAYNTNELDNIYSASPILHCNESGGPFVFTVKGTDNNGCYEMDNVSITIADRAYVFMPTAFTPNGDGRNDRFRGNAAGVIVDVFKVYNREGRVLFSTSDIRNGWDGTYNGVPQDAGVYFWMVKLRSENGLSRVQKGDVTLVR